MSNPLVDREGASVSPEEVIQPSPSGEDIEDDAEDHDSDYTEPTEVQKREV